MRAFKTMAFAAAVALATPLAAGPGLAPAAHAQVAAAEVQAAIELQLEAIGRGDFDEAFAYASPAIRQRFMTAAKFAEMVRSGYPMVLRAARHKFGAPALDGPRLRQPVVITDAGGRVWVADYHMARAGGVWVIDGVSLRRAPQAGA